MKIECAVMDGLSCSWSEPFSNSMRRESSTCSMSVGALSTRAGLGPSQTTVTPPYSRP